MSVPLKTQKPRKIFISFVNPLLYSKNYPGANTEDILNHLKPILRHKPELVIFHSGTNDIVDNKHTISFLDRAIELVNKECPNTPFAISLPIINKNNDDGRYSKKLHDLKREIQKHIGQIKISH